MYPLNMVIFHGDVSLPVAEVYHILPTSLHPLLSLAAPPEVVLFVIIISSVSLAFETPYSDPNSEVGFVDGF